MNQQTAATTIIDYTRHLSRLVNDLLDTAQLEAGKITLNHALFSVQELVEQIVDQNLMQAKIKEIIISYCIDDDLPALLVGDNDRLRQILNNLVANAVKFTDQGSVHIQLYRASPQQWAIQVADTGRGIPSESYSEIFEPFQQLESTTHGKRNGYGLGLAIVQQLTKIMHGEVRIDSEVGRGSTFTILLPLEPSEGVKG